jgi:hypothetical protein
MLDHAICNPPREGFGGQILGRANPRSTLNPHHRTRIVQYIFTPAQNPKTSFSA